MPTIAILEPEDFKVVELIVIEEDRPRFLTVLSTTVYSFFPSEFSEAPAQ